MIDVSKLSLKELQELQVQITKEKKKRDCRTKSAVCSPYDNELWALMGEKLQRLLNDANKDKYQDNWSRLASSARSSIFTLCDVAFMNASFNSKGAITFRSGSDLYLVGDKVDKYKAMYEEIIRTFFKYAKEVEE